MKTQHGRELTGAEMAMMLDEFCNAADSKEVTDFVQQITTRTHRTLQQRIMGLFVKTIEAWAETKENRYDQRNEATIKLARKMIAGSGDKYDRCLP
jgi:hypothetical protein